MRRISKALLLSLLAMPAHAADKAKPVEIRCDDVDSLDGQIEYCSDNKQAKETAESCGRQLLQAIEDAGPELAQVFKATEAQDVSRQQAKFHFSSADYERTKNRLDQLIDQTSRNMHVLAAYPTVMMDDLDVGLEPVACYTDNYRAVERVVKNLDEKITELKKARRTAAELQAGTHVRDQDVGSSSTNPILSSKLVDGEPAPAPRPVPRGKSKNKGSDITGTEKSHRDEILSNFQLRDQLTGP